jgi:hypothetical protein
MAEKIVSPGVFTREKDSSFVPQGVSEIGQAIVAPFPKGPIVPTTVETQADLQALYGVPNGTYYGQYAAEEYLRNGGRVTVVRVSGLGGYTQSNALALKVTLSGSTHTVGVLMSTAQNSTQDGFSSASFLQDVGGTGYSDVETGVLTLSGSSVASTAYSISLDPKSPDYIKNVFGESALGLKSGYNYLIFNDKLASYTGSSAPSVTASISVISSVDFSYDISTASTPWFVSQKISGTRYQLLKFHTLGYGNNANTQVKVAVDSVRVGGSVQGSDYGTFNVTVREYGDTDSRPIALETFEGVNLDPSSPKYISRVIGDISVTVDTNGDIVETGDWETRSKYIRVEVKDSDTYPVTAIPAGFEKLALPVNESTIPVATYTTASLTSPYSSYSGFDFTKSDNLNYLRPTTDTLVYGNNVSFSLDETLGSNGLGLELTGSTQTATDLKQRRFMVGFQGGFDGLNPTISASFGDDISATNTGGLDCSTVTASGSVAYIRALNAISNQEEFDINLITTPGIVRNLHPSVTTKAIDVCETRGDCFYIAELVGSNGTQDDVLAQAELVNSSYVATYFPWVKLRDSNTNKLLTVPPSTIMAGVYAANDRIGGPWYAPAGFERGGLPNVVKAVTKIRHADKDTLYEGKVNPLIKFPNQGVVAWGQKTLQNKESALDRINVRRLLINLKKFVASTSKYLVFEQNTTATRRRFLSAVSPYMKEVESRQGLYAFRIVMDDSNNGPEIIDRNILQGHIFVQPTKTSEYILIDFNVLPTGASFGA